MYAGGTDVLVKLRAHKLAAKHIIDVKGIPTFCDITLHNGILRIGCAVTLTDIARHPLVKAVAPALREGCNQVGSVPIRNKATLIGNIQNASPAADGLNAAWGLDARVVLVSKGGERRIPLEQYVLGPGRTAILQDEAAAYIELPTKEWDYQEFFKTGRRRALAISIINGMAAFKFNEEHAVEDVRLCVGAVAATPLRLAAAEQVLLGKIITPQLAEQAAGVAIGSISPITDIRAAADYRRYIAGVEIQRQITRAMEIFL